MLLSRQSYSFQRTAGQLVALESALVLVLLILLVFSQSWLETPFRFASLALPLLQLPPCHPIGLQLRQGYFFVRKLMLQSVLP